MFGEESGHRKVIRLEKLIEEERKSISIRRAFRKLEDEELLEAALEKKRAEGWCDVAIALLGEDRHQSVVFHYHPHHLRA